jgi:hypothetical protein
MQKTGCLFVATRDSSREVRKAIEWLKSYAQQEVIYLYVVVGIPPPKIGMDFYGHAL